MARYGKRFLGGGNKKNMPDLWYWVHIHNVIASITGHKKPQISYYGGQELPIRRAGEVQLAKNGFAIITRTSSSLTEVFHDEDGTQVYMQIHRF